MPRRRAPPGPLRWFDSSPEVIRYVVMFASEIRRKRVSAMRQHTHWRWHQDEVYVEINGEMRYL